MNKKVSLRELVGARIVAAICIAVYGTTAAVWAVSATIGALSVGILLTRPKCHVVK